MIGGWFKILKCIRLRNEVDGEGGGVRNRVSPSGCEYEFAMMCPK